MSRKIILISEALSAPFDEGFKNVVFSLHKQLEMRGDSLSVTREDSVTENMNIKKIRLNKLFLNNKLRLLIKSYRPDIVLYFPFASCSFYSFLRARILKLLSGNAKVAILGGQHRKHTRVQDFIIKIFLKPDLLLLLGRSDEDYYLKKGLAVRVLPPAVDCTRFSPVAEGEKNKIRDEMNIHHNRKVVLHVGHIKTSRNVEILADLQKVDNIQVVIVGSSSTDVEDNLKERLEREGVIVIEKYMSEISRIYKMSDIYVFPVQKKTASIDMPLSVLEAMACNLPVVTTRFAGLLEYFHESEGFNYFNITEELVNIVMNMNKNNYTNRKKIEFFTWKRFSDEAVAACERLI